MGKITLSLSEKTIKQGKILAGMMSGSFSSMVEKMIKDYLKKNTKVKNIIDQATACDISK